MLRVLEGGKEPGEKGGQEIPHILVKRRHITESDGIFFWVCNVRPFYEISREEVGVVLGVSVTN